LDKLVETKRERFWNREAWIRDQWIKAEAAKLAPGSRVLDAGAGASKYRPFFSHCRYETQDFCKYEGPLVKYVQPIDHVCDITKIPLPDACLDAILCTEVFEHVPDPISVLKEFSRLIKKGGRLWLTAPHGSQVHMKPYHYYNGFSHFWYRHWLPFSGFQVDRVDSQGGPGRLVCANFQAFFADWRIWERELPPVKRALSLTGRMGVKLPVHYLLPWLLPKFDPYLDTCENSIGLMVAATRLG